MWALGWLHWSEAELYDADINAILIGVEGHAEWTRATFGDGSDGSGSVPKAPVTPARFDALFGSGPRRRRK